jgi:hypothetical protein
MEKLPLPPLFAALVVTGVYGWLRHSSQHELEEMFLIGSALFSVVYYLGRWGWRRYWPKPGGIT